MTQQFDHVVVGGGVVGSSTAWNLATTGHEVALVERHTIASGASGGGGHRGVRANGRDLRELPLAARAYQLWPELVDRVGSQIDYRRQGGFSLLEPPYTPVHTLGRIDQQIAIQESFGIPTRLLGRGELDELLPGVNDTVTGAVYNPLDGIGDHTATTRALAASAQEHGATVLEHHSVIDLVTEPGGSVRVVTEHGDLLAKKSVVLAANSYTPALVAKVAEVHIPVWRFLPQYSLLTAPESFTLGHLVGHGGRGMVVKHIEGNTIMLSGGARGTWNAEADQGVHSLGTFATNLAALIGTYPELTASTVQYSDASRPEAASYDDIPIIDRLPVDAPVLYATGWSGHGFAISPAVGEALASWASTGTKPAVLEPFSIGRFGPS